MNTLLASRYVEVFRRLLLGMHIMDAPRDQPVAHNVEMRVEPTPMVAPLSDDQERWLRGRIDSGMPLSDGWSIVSRHASGRYAVSYPAGQPRTHLDIRVLDRSERVVPRRFRVPLAPLGTPESLVTLDALPVGQRSRVLSFYPGAAYDMSERITGLRGRVVVSDGGTPPRRVPVRWARIEARLSAAGAVVAWAHGDHKGEFLLVLPPEAIASPSVQLPRILTLQLTAHGRRLPAVLPPALIQRADPFWDAPLEVLGPPGIVPASDLVARGRAIPPDYTGSVTQPVTFVYSEIVSAAVPAFDIT